VSRLDKFTVFIKEKLVVLSINSTGFDFTFHYAKPISEEVAMFLSQLRICKYAVPVDVLHTVSVSGTGRIPAQIGAGRHAS
jgi:hypothetical protein